MSVDPKVQSKIADIAFQQKIRTGIVFVLFAGAVFALQTAIDRYIGPYGAWVWIVFTFMVLFGLLNTWLVRSMLLNSNDYVSSSNAGRLGANASVLFQRVAAKTGVDMKDYVLVVAKDQTPNAFMAGGKGSFTMCLHQGLFGVLDDDEIEAVIAHEVGHSVNNDIMMLVFVTSVISAFIIIGKILLEIARFSLYTGGNESKSSSDDSDDSLKKFFAKLGLAGTCFLIGIVCILVGNLIAPVFMAFLSRSRERLADLFATAHGYGEKLANALKKLENAPKSSAKNSALRALYINEPAANLIELLFSSHPPILNRVNDIGKIVKGDEGLIPDSIENKIRTLITWIVLPLVGAFFVRTTDFPNLFGVPWVYIATIAWMFSLSFILLMGTSVNPIKTTPALAIFGLVIGLVLWATGFAAINLTNGLPVVGQLTSVMFWAWMVKPIVGGLRTNFDILAPVSDGITYAGVVYAITTLYVLLTVV